MDLKKIAQEIRSYPGVTRKRIIPDVLKYFSIPKEGNIIAAFGEDAAVIDFGEEALLLAADGIMEDLMMKNAFWAGYCSVLVNVNDIAAMGGIPLGMVSVISMKKGEVLDEVLKGIQEGIRKFGVPMVGGHTHPDCNYNAVDVAILGHVKKDEVILSSTAEVGDDIIFTMDIQGVFTPKIPYSWDSTRTKEPEVIQKQIGIMNHIAGKKLLSAGKDISNPGSLGTLAMLLETSGKGGEIDLRSIPAPDNVDFTQWLKAYQGYGFVVTCKPENSEEALKQFNSVGGSSAVVGRITDDRKLKIGDGKDTLVLFDFKKDVITGCRK
ncbi:MAG: methanogenesis marker 2 protein [Methanomassiliicoccales archaeon]|nr:MAG: methanogenesis marker 2 protein [Methanomassiliicoccales archaeon]